MFKKIICMGILLIMCFSFGACKGNDEIDFTIGYSNMNTGFPQNLECIVNTFAEWDTLRGDTAQLTELDAKYNEQFFTANSLVIYAFTRSSGGSTTEISKISKDGKKLVVEAVDNGLGYMDAITNGIIIMEVKKSDMQGVTDIEIILITQS